MAITHHQTSLPYGQQLAAGKKIGFGKYKHRTWLQVYHAEESRSYFMWAITAMDVTRFEGPSESDLQFFIRSVENSLTTQMAVQEAYDIVAAYRSRVLDHKVGKVKSANVIHYDNPYHPTDASPQQDLNIRIADFEAACLKAFGSFPYKGWQTH